MATQHTVEEAIARAYIIKENNPHYSMQNRGYGLNAPYYDCSSFVGSCWQVAVNNWPPATPDMVRIYLQQGFTHFSYNYNILQRGDILVWNDPGTSGYGANGHTAIYLGNDKIIEATANSAAGPNGGVIDTRGPDILAWQDILRGDSRVKITNITLITP